MFQNLVSFLCSPSELFQAMCYGLLEYGFLVIFLLYCLQVNEAFNFVESGLASPENKEK